jgi:type 1 fimbria pilin
VANAVYPDGKDAILEGEIDLLDDTIKVAVCSSTYTYSASDTYYDDLSGVLASSGALASKTVSAGVFDAADVDFASVTGTIEAWVIYKDTGDTATSPLIAFFDTKTGSAAIDSGALAAAPYTIQWDASGILSI